MSSSAHSEGMHEPGGLILPPGARPPYRPSPPRATPAGTAQLGVAARSTLIARGHTDAELRAAVHHGRLLRVAPGWYARPDADPRLLRSLRHGFRLTCLDALEHHGVWIPPRPADDRRTHAFRPRPNGISARDLLPHTGGPRTWTSMHVLAPPLLALEHATRCLDGESAAIVLESALHLGLCEQAEVEELLARASARTRARIGIISTGSESGSETRTVRSLRRRGYHVEQQVYVAGVGFIDAYVGGVFLEIDGRAHHSDPGAFDRDRARDLAMRERGLEVLRLSYGQVWHRWPETRASVLATIAAVGPVGRRRVEQLQRSGSW